MVDSLIFNPSKNNIEAHYVMNYDYELYVISDSSTADQPLYTKVNQLVLKPGNNTHYLKFIRPGVHLLTFESAITPPNVKMPKVQISKQVVQIEAYLKWNDYHCGLHDCFVHRYHAVVDDGRKFLITLWIPM